MGLLNPMGIIPISGGGVIGSLQLAVTRSLSAVPLLSNLAKASLSFIPTVDAGYNLACLYVYKVCGNFMLRTC